MVIFFKFHKRELQLIEATIILNKILAQICMHVWKMIFININESAIVVKISQSKSN